MSRATSLLQEIIAKARRAEALVSHAETKQVLVEIRLAARCAIESEKGTRTAVTDAPLQIYHD